MPESVTSEAEIALKPVKIIEKIEFLKFHSTKT